MISKAESKDKQEIYHMWKSIFAADDGGYTDFYFKNYYRNQETFIKKDKNEIIGCCSKHPHSLMLHGRLLRCSMIVGMAVKPQHRHKGVMHELMDTILDEINHQELVTMIQAYEPKLYEPFGFKTIYKRRIWTIKRNEVKKIKPEISLDVFPKDMLRLYGQFMSRFNGYIIRDVAYFETLLKEVEAEKGKVIGYYNERKLEGYALVYLENRKLVIRECLYLNSKALNHMINYVLNVLPEVTLQVSGSENLTKLFPNSTFEEVGYTMMRLNDNELFNRLYNCDVDGIEEAMMLNNQPLYMHENR